MKEAEQKDTVDLIACHECDALLSRRSLPRRTTARCPRCGSLLYRALSSNLDRVCAITLAALITFLIAQAFPIVELDANGLVSQTTLIGAIVALWDENMQVVAVLVFCSTILFPLTELVALLYVLVPLRAGYVPGGFNIVLRAIQAVRPWGMIEVFMLGILVTLVKMVSIARVIPEAALFAFGALTLMIAVVVSFDPGVLWDLAERLPRRRAARVRAKRMRRNRETAGSATKHG
ncbi:MULTISPECIES: paraquat-inducible protein A [unclassified Caballeronia]|uniref:paraquat-inducible protein A n=1 Tax=unclassified Caballeronia TaxID=2646786 RepID=UPI00286458BB|nr:MULTISPECIES: paraquat-inducible protein A [unclassified Caballeronia]MDR5749584.1 paraquat-inducible protein A [Caballeronia sp. LZ024]MDR5843286.1 paraquat-inducible protein A [Caballeronia sp. LZ031]